MAAAATSNFSSLLLLLLLSLLSTVFTSMHGFTDDPLIQQVVSSSDGRDDLLTSAEHQFSAFKIKYGKTYPTQEEEDYRFGVFISNLRLARRNQIMDPTAVHGVTKFSDLTPSEFRWQYLSTGSHIQLPHDTGKWAPDLSTDDLRPKKNWIEEGAVTAVKDQGKICNGCWAFSTIAVLEGAHYLANNRTELVELSVQQLIDCSTTTCTNYSDGREPLCNEGCKSGHRGLAFKYINITGGVMKADDYKFIAETGNCKASSNDKRYVASLSEFGFVRRDEDQYAAYLVEYGPLAVSTDLDFAQTYLGGTTCTHKKHPGNISHAVTLVGYEKGTTDRDWIIKNSYGENWGERGYFRVCKHVLTNNNTWEPTAMYAVAKNKTRTLNYILSA
ncbi:hypothetical protein Dsin_003590 [Dipteronia sinensis]|uniref:Cysteine proteinase n=1 Tax=Dipteronia sinensis TaxID=43782 RepID=A0AAE0B9T1_9ROSI|nr:hypothetical protein Dsin_003590 [Dipteronia sinensis]